MGRVASRSDVADGLAAVTTPAEPAPDWLVAWREKQAAQAPQALTQPARTNAPESAPAAPLAPALPAPAAKQLGTANRPTSGDGFARPARWAFDGGKRREPVYDLDCQPPRVVRKVGWHRCLKCGSPFWSKDVMRLRLCGTAETGCRGDEDRFR